MNAYDKKTILLLKINFWFSVYLNIFFEFLARMIYASVYEYKLLLMFCVFFPLTIAEVKHKVSLEMWQKDYSNIFSYIGLLIISCFLIYKTYIDTTLALTMTLVILVIIEFLMIFVIIYRYKIRNKIIKIFKKKRSK